MEASESWSRLRQPREELRHQDSCAHTGTREQIRCQDPASSDGEESIPAGQNPARVATITEFRVPLRNQKR